MASGLTNYGEDQVNDALFGGDSMGGTATSTAPGTWYIGLMTAAAGEAGGGTELAIGTNGYARIAVVNNVTNFPASSGGSKTNGVDLLSAISSGAWGGGANIVGIAFFDAATAGNMWAYADIAAGNQQAITGANQRWSLPAGSLTLTQD